MEDNNNVGIRTIIVLAIVVLAVVGGLFYLLSQDNNGNDAGERDDMMQMQNEMDNQMPSQMRDRNMTPPEDLEEGEMPEDMGRQPGMMQMEELTTEETEEVTAIFESGTDSEIEAYCQKNMIYCMSYCRDINPEDNHCASMVPSDSGMPPEGMEPPQ